MSQSSVRSGVRQLFKLALIVTLATIALNTTIFDSLNNGNDNYNALNTDKHASYLIHLMLCSKKQNSYHQTILHRHSHSQCSTQEHHIAYDHVSIAS